MRVVLIEDNPQVLGVVSMMLGALGHVVESFRSGTRAVEYFQSHAPYDLVLTDYHLQELTALDILPSIASHPSAGIVVYTGSGDPQAVTTLYGDRVNMLQKPFTLDELSAAIASACAQAVCVQHDTVIS